MNNKSSGISHLNCDSLNLFTTYNSLIKYDPLFLTHLHTYIQVRIDKAVIPSLIFSSAEETGRLLVA